MPSDWNDALERLPGFLDSILRGIGQVMLHDSRIASLLFLIGVFFNSMLFGFAVLAGTAVSKLTAMLLGADRSLVRAGLFGFNGALVTITLLYFLQPGILTWVYVVLAAAGSTVVMAAPLNLLGVWKIPVLTAPFVLTTVCFVLAGPLFPRLRRVAGA